MNEGLFIPGNVPALKNNKQIVWPRGGPTTKSHPRIVPSKRVTAWRNQTLYHWIHHRDHFHRMIMFLEPPYDIDFLFVRDSKRKFDYTNALDTVQDEMVRHKWIPDDNSTVLRPFLIPYQIDKEEPGVWISLHKG